MKQTVVSGLFFVLTGVFLAGCDRLRSGAGESDSPAVARVGAAKITLDDFQARLRETPAAYQQYVSSAEGRRQFLNLLIREKVILSEAQRLGISRDPAYRQAVQKYKAQAKRRQREYEESLQVESAIQRLRTKDLAATDSDVEAYYTKHQADYDKPLEVQASHILLSSEPEAQAALARLKAGEPFDKVARDVSNDPATAVQGGKLTPFRKGALVPEFEDAAFALKNGELSGIVKTQFGFHIIRKQGEKRLPARALADVKKEIRARLERDKFNEWVAAKQAKAGVTVDEQAVAQVSLEESLKP